MSSRADVVPDVRQLRERFMIEGSLDEPILRRSVLESWRRSQALHVHPDRLEVPFVSEPNTESRLAHAAGPVLQRIIDDLAAQAITAVLTSADGVVLERTVSEAALMGELDAVLLAPGYSFAEEFAGTNGIGTALETGRPAFIRGGEHYVGPFGRLACAGAPIRDPVTGRMIGVVDLTCWARDSDPLLTALAKSAGGQIEDRMRASAHESEIALLEAYLHHDRRVSLGVLAIGGDVVLMNRYLRQTLGANDQVALLAHASDMVSSPVAGTLLAVLPSGNTAKVTAADRTTLRRGRTNVIFHVRVAAEAGGKLLGTGQSALTRIAGLAGRSSSWLRCCRQVERCCRDRDWVVLEGERGSGRAKLAAAVAQHVKPDRTVRVLRAETIPTAAQFVAAVMAETETDDFAVVVADIEEIKPDAIEPVVSILQSRVGRGWIAATKGPSTHPDGIDELLLPFFTHTVTVAPLRHRIEDIEELVPFLLREITRGADVRLSPDAMRQLSKLPWPGNVTQLRRVLAETVTRQRSGLISADKLPPECRAVTRRILTQIEALERDAIVRSLEENGGNKLNAAAALGISRATIYRKIKDYGIA